MTTKCVCNNNFDLRCMCYPRKDYRKIAQHAMDKYRDFRKCPMRFTSATEFILNDYDKYQLIENATTVQNKIKIFKKIIIKDFKLTREDYEIILNIYLIKPDNIINPLRTFRIRSKTKSREVSPEVSPEVLPEILPEVLPEVEVLPKDWNTSYINPLRSILSRCRV